VIISLIRLSLFFIGSSQGAFTVLTPTIQNNEIFIDYNKQQTGIPSFQLPQTNI